MKRRENTNILRDLVVLAMSICLTWTAIGLCKKISVEQNISKQTITENERINKVVDELYEDYGVKIYINENPTDYYKGTMESYSFSLDAPDNDVLSVLYHLRSVLSKYNDVTLNKISKQFFIVRDLDKHMEDGSIRKMAGTCVKELGNNYIVVSTLINLEERFDYSYVLHHEIFHSITSQVLSNDLSGISNELIDKIVDIDDCEMISDYACFAGRDERLAETWAAAMDGNYYNVKSVQVMRDHLAKSFLKEN